MNPAENIVGIIAQVVDTLPIIMEAVGARQAMRGGVMHTPMGMLSLRGTSGCNETAILREAWATLPESSSRPLPATLAQSRNLAHASLKTAVLTTLKDSLLDLSHLGNLQFLWVPPDRASSLQCGVSLLSWFPDHM